LVGFSTTNFTGRGSRHCHGINFTHPMKEDECNRLVTAIICGLTVINRGSVALRADDFACPRSKAYKSTGFNVREYDVIAEWYASERIDQTGVPEATTLASSIPRGSLVLDVGCGNGIPITRALLSRGHRVIGLDSSSAMLAHFRRNCPEAFAVRGIVQSCPFADCAFDAAVALGVIFHLNPADAIRAIATVSRVVKRGAPFLFTSGDVDSLDGKEGKMNGVTFRYFSYSVHSYGRILGDHGFTLVDVHADSGNNTYYLAKKAEPAS